MSKQTLFDISDDFVALSDLINDADDNMEDPAVVAALEQWETELVDNIEVKVDNCMAFVQTLLARANARKAESKRLAERAKVDENAAKSLKERVKFVFMRHKIKRMDTTRFLVTLAKNGGVQPVHIAVEPERLPEDYQCSVTTVTADKEAIRDALKAGQLVEGCYLLERGESLRIK